MPAIRTSPCPQLMDTTLRRHSEVINKLLPNAIHKSRDVSQCLIEVYTYIYIYITLHYIQGCYIPITLIKF